MCRVLGKLKRLVFRGSFGELDGMGVGCRCLTFSAPPTAWEQTVKEPWLLLMMGEILEVVDATCRLSCNTTQYDLREKPRGRWACVQAEMHRRVRWVAGGRLALGKMRVCQPPACRLLRTNQQI